MDLLRQIDHYLSSSTISYTTHARWLIIDILPQTMIFWIITLKYTTLSHWELFLQPLVTKLSSHDVSTIMW